MGIEEIMQNIRELDPQERNKLFYQLLKEYPQLQNTTDEWYPGDDEFKKLRST